MGSPPEETISVVIRPKHIKPSVCSNVFRAGKGERCMKQSIWVADRVKKDQMI